jgi:carbon storage regulator
MLVLARRNGEEVLIADNIRVTVVGVKKNQVRLGITAPASVPVVRRELLEECPDDAGAATTSCPALPSEVEQKDQPR